jgi:hypothetical protein
MVIIILGYCPSRGDSHIINDLGKVRVTYLFCINKENNTELSEAITSMYRWYNRATKCYAYFSDVSIIDDNHLSPSLEQWESAFRNSRWFTRGWTLQELLAPPSVEFFYLKGTRLDDKRSLEQ